MILSIILTSTGVAMAQEWQRPGTLNGSHYTRVSANGTSPDGEVQTDLTIQCYPGQRGYIAFIYGVHDEDKIKSFDFLAFEGKDALTADLKLTTVKVRTKRGNIIVNGIVSGGLTNEDVNVFEFRLAANINARSHVARLKDALIFERRESFIQWIVTDRF